MNLIKKLGIICLFSLHLSGISQNLVVNNVFLNHSDNIYIKINDISLRNNAILNTNGNLQIKGDWQTGDSAHFNCLNNSLVHFVGINQQRIKANGNAYADIVIRNAANTSSHIVLEDNIRIKDYGELYFYRGIINTDTNIVVFDSLSTYSNASDSSFINGKIQYLSNSNFQYPCGDVSIRDIGDGINEYRIFSPIEFSTNDNNCIVEYFYKDTNFLWWNNISPQFCIDTVSKREWWKISGDSTLYGLKIFYNNNSHSTFSACKHGFCLQDSTLFNANAISIVAYNNQWEKYNSTNIGSHNNGCFYTDSTINNAKYISYGFSGESTYDTVYDQLCYGSTYNLADGRQVIINSDTSFLSQIPTSIGCDSIILANIDVLSTYYDSICIDICNGDNYQFADGYLLTNIQNDILHTSNLQSLSFCDSVIVENISVNQHYNIVEDVIVCYGDNYVFPDLSTTNNLINQYTHISNLNTVNACDSIITTNITINDLSSVASLLQNIKCYGDADGEAMVIASGGILPYTYSWSSSPVQTTSTATSLTANIYTVTITDSMNCTSTAQIEVLQNAKLVASIDFPYDKTICLGESEILSNTIYGGMPPYIYNWWCNQSNCFIDLSDIANPIIDPLISTKYYLQITDSNQCLSDIDSVNITISDLQVDAGQDIYFNEGEVLYLNAYTNDYNVIWEWSPQMYLDNYSIENPVATPLNDITYYVEIQNQFYCKARDTISLFMEEQKIPNTITPNGDGNNDTWIIDKLDFYPNAVVEIYNRWGSRLYISEIGYLIPWDATYNGNNLPTSAYYYVIDLGIESNEKIEGVINVIREEN